MSRGATSSEVVEALRAAARVLAVDPDRLDDEVAAVLRAEPRILVMRGAPLPATRADVDRVRDRAIHLTNHGEPLDAARAHAGGDVHSSLAAHPDDVLGRPVMYDCDRATGTARIPDRLTIDGRVPDLEHDDERALFQAHVRAVLEELTHAAGFARGAGAYAPLTSRGALFDRFLRTPEGRQWARDHGFTAAQIVEMPERVHEADVVEVLRPVNPFSPAEIERYPVRRAFELWGRMFPR